MLLVGFDAYISHRRIKQFGPLAEVNLLVRQVIQDFGLKAGLTAGFLQNLAIVCGLLWFKLGWLLAFFAGVKFGLALMQLKSLQMETYVERVLAKLRQKQQAATKQN